MENVVPIRQSTLDMFLDYRKVNENLVFNQFPSEQVKKETKAKLAIQPDSMKPFENKDGETFFRVAGCNRVVQNSFDRPVYHIDIKS